MVEVQEAQEVQKTQELLDEIKQVTNDLVVEREEKEELEKPSEDENLENLENKKIPSSENEDNINQEEKEEEPDSDRDDEPIIEDGDDNPVIEKELLERAVRAGLSLVDTEAITNREALVRITERLETSSRSADKEDTEDVKEGEDDMLAEIPDLDPEEFSEEVVEVFSGMKKVIQEQQKAIKSLQGSVNTSSKEGWANAQFAALGKDYEEAFGKGDYAVLDKKNQQARDKLERYMDFAIEEAKTEGKSLFKKDAFKQALKTGFSAIVNKTKGKSIKRDAEKRNRKVINRPNTTNSNLVEENLSYEDRIRLATANVEKLMK